MQKSLCNEFECYEFLTILSGTQSFSLISMAGIYILSYAHFLILETFLEASEYIFVCFSSLLKMWNF